MTLEVAWDHSFFLLYLSQFVIIFSMLQRYSAQFLAFAYLWLHIQYYRLKPKYIYIWYPFRATKGSHRLMNTHILFWVNLIFFEFISIWNRSVSSIPTLYFLSLLSQVHVIKVGCWYFLILGIHSFGFV